MFCYGSESARVLIRTSDRSAQLDHWARREPAPHGPVVWFWIGAASGLVRIVWLKRADHPHFRRLDLRLRGLREEAMISDS